jgi:uncharacterized protein
VPTDRDGVTAPADRRPGSGGSGQLTAFLVATALIGAHVVDDSFVQPEPGTSAADHLAGGLVPLAGLLLAAVAYRRLRRPGARALVAFAVGVFGLIVGVEGWYYALEVGPARDDYTGIVAAVAGVTLIGLAVVVGWTAGSTAERWRVPGSGHTGGLDAQPAEYERRVLDFFDRALLRQ